MKKLRFALVVSLLLVLFVVGGAFAQEGPPPRSPEPYTGPAGNLDGSSEFSPAEGDVGVTSLIQNGAFDEWVGNRPVGWDLWYSGGDGWEVAHPSQVDLAINEEGMNNALGWFIRNIGGTGSYSVGAMQQLDLPSGYYFVNLSEAIWDGSSVPYNSVAWYAISEHGDAAMVPAEEWRELDSYAWQCWNKQDSCNYAGRDETVWIDDGDYFHVMAMMKFPKFNDYSFFLFDDISVVPANPTAPEADYANGFYEWKNDSPDDWKCHIFDVDDCGDYDSTIVDVPVWAAR